MAGTQPYRIKTISDYHQTRGLPKPEHPLISVINLDEVKHWPGERPTNVVFDFYLIALKRNFNAPVKYRYGQQAYDFDEGVMFFIAPGQVFSVIADSDYQLSGWMILVHPDFF